MQSVVVQAAQGSLGCFDHAGIQIGVNLGEGHGHGGCTQSGEEGIGSRAGNADLQALDVGNAVDGLGGDDVAGRGSPVAAQDLDAGGFLDLVAPGGEQVGGIQLLQGFLVGNGIEQGAGQNVGAAIGGIEVAGSVRHQVSAQSHLLRNVGQRAQLVGIVRLKNDRTVGLFIDLGDQIGHHLRQNAGGRLGSAVLNHNRLDRGVRFLSGLRRFGSGGLVVAASGKQGKDHYQRQKHCDQFLHFCFSFFVFYFLWLHMLAPNKIRVNLFRGEFRKSVQISHCFQRVHDLPRFSCPVDD